MNFFDPETLDNPYPHYQKWREDMPIWWAEDANGWVLSRYDDVRTVLKNAALFSSKSMGEGDQRAIALPLLTDDAPRHTQLRAIVNKAFTSRTLKDMEAEVSNLVEEILDDIAAFTLQSIAISFRNNS